MEEHARRVNVVADAYEKLRNKVTSLGLSQEQVKFDKFSADLATLKGWLDAGKISFDEYIMRVDNLTTAFEGNNEEGQNLGKQMDNLLNQGIANMIQGFAQAAATGENVGAGLLAGIGNTMVQLGGLLILNGKAVIAFKESLKNLNGGVAIVAGVAMVAAGTVFANAAKKAGGGSGGSAAPSYSHSQNVASQDPEFLQQNGGMGGEIIGKIRGNDWVLMNQVSSNRRSGLSSSYNLG